MEQRIPKVSVCIVTYNQEQYIEECLQSVVDQEVDFPIEVIISDDCSTDRTPEIIQRFANQYSFIKPVLRKKNIGPYINMLETYEIAHGLYIAHLDGDDYWLKNKLKNQVNFMDKNSECMISWTRSYVQRGKELLPDLITEKMTQKKYFQSDVAQLITVGFNSSKMFRKSATYERNVEFEIVDYYLNVEKLKKGFAAFIDSDFYTVYRAGIGIASDGIKTKIILKKTFIHFLNKYPNLSYSISAAITLQLLIALKKIDIDLIREFLGVFSKNLSLRGVLLIIKRIEEIKSFKLPRG